MWSCKLASHNACKCPPSATADAPPPVEPEDAQQLLQVGPTSSDSAIVIFGLASWHFTAGHAAHWLKSCIGCAVLCITAGPASHATLEEAFSLSSFHAPACPASHACRCLACNYACLMLCVSSYHAPAGPASHTTPQKTPSHLQSRRLRVQVRSSALICGATFVLGQHIHSAIPACS
jgi:hypothetical protein